LQLFDLIDFIIKFATFEIFIIILY